MRIAILAGQVRTTATLAGELRRSVTLAGRVDSYTPPTPGGGPSLDFSDADNSMYLGAL